MHVLDLLTVQLLRVNRIECSVGCCSVNGWENGHVNKSREGTCYEYRALSAALAADEVEQLSTACDYVGHRNIKAAATSQLPFIQRLSASLQFQFAWLPPS